MWWYNDKIGNFHVGSQPTKEVNEVIEDDLDYVVIADKPSEAYYYDGSNWILKEIVPLSNSELKDIGKQYNGYQVPLNEEAQIAVTSVAVQYLAGLFTGTVFHFSNGVKMPCSTNEFLPFAQWFALERNRFFV